MNNRNMIDSYLHSLACAICLYLAQLQLVADPGVVSLIPARSRTFAEIDREMFSTVILPLPLIQERLVSVTSMCTKYWLTP